MVIAIDGPAGSGKSTIAKMIAEKLGFYYLNTGSFYRAYTLSALENGVNVEDPSSVLENANKIKLSVEKGKICINGVDRENDLHTSLVDKYCSPVSNDPSLREKVNTLCRLLTKNLNIVTEGRDTTTVIFPDAEFKFYFDAKAEIRAERRMKERGNKNYNEILDGILKRDKNDKEKSVGALKIDKNAIYLDTTNLTINEVCEKVLKVVKDTTKNKEKVVMDKDTSMRTYMEEHFMSIPDLEVGQIVTGTVVQTNDETVLVDIGYKSEGQVPLDEFMEAPNIGDKVKLTIIKLDNGRGQVIVSKKKAEAKEKLNALEEAAKTKTPVLGKFSKVIKGGYEVELGADYRGFCPLSKADIVRVEEPENLLGKTDFFIIDRFHQSSSLKSVVSRRAYLEKKIEENRDEFFKSAQVGDIVEGAVKSFTSFGAFIDLGGFDGLLHINDMTWGRVTRPKDFVKKGQVIQLKIINLDPETKKINLSLKEMSEDPWSTFDQKYKLGDVIKRKVVRIANFGVFIEIEPGIEGLAHVSELSWTRRITDPHEYAKVGDVVEAKILGWDLDHKRVSLGLKQLTENPWETIEERYPIGKVIKAPVVKVTPSAAYINLEDGIDGFLHIDDVSWGKKPKKMSEFCKEGDIIEVVITSVNKDERRIKLSVKAMEENPWAQLKKDYPKYSLITGTISNVTDFGVFVRVVGDIEGLIGKANLSSPDESDKSEDEVLESYKKRVGESITSMVMDVNTSAQKLSLSIKEMVKRSEESEISKYMSFEEKKEDTYNPFAEALKGMEGKKKGKKNE